MGAGSLVHDSGYAHTRAIRGARVSMIWRSATRSWCVFAAVTVLIAGLMGQAPAAADTFGSGLAHATTVVEGTAGVDEVQRFQLSATGGTFTLSLDGETTVPIAFGSSAVDVQTALVDLANVGPAEIEVTRLPNAGGGFATEGADPYILTFGGALGASDVSEVTVDVAGLVGSNGASPEAGVVTTTPGREPTDEVQRLRVRAFEGTYTVTFDGQTSGPLEFDLSADALRVALEALPNLDPGDLVVTGGPGDRSGSSPYTVAFSGNFANTDVAPLSTDPGALIFGVAGATLDALPASALPIAWSIQSGQVVGILSSSGDGWSWTPEAGYEELPRWEGQPFVPVDVNDRGLVLATVNPGSDGGNLLWSEEEGVRTIGDGLTGVALNNAGQVVGGTGGEAFVWSEESGTTLLGTLPTSPDPASPGRPRGQDPWAKAEYISDGGQVVGVSTVGSGYFLHAFSWTAENGMVDLGTLGFDDVYFGGEPGVRSTFATDMNEAGVVVGASVPSDAPRFEHRGFMWTEAGGMVDLGLGPNSSAMMINEAGQLAVTHETCDEVDCYSHSSVWSAADGLKDIEGLNGGTGADIEVLGESGAVLGSSFVGPDSRPGPAHPFYWDPEVGTVDLGNPSDVRPASASQPFALSATGEILAFRNLPSEEAEGATEAASEGDLPVEILYWPNAGPGQPDQTIRSSSQTAFAGSRVYNTTGAGQVRSTSTRRGSTATFVVRTRNTGARPSRFTLRGRSSVSGFDVRYLAGGRDVTRQVAAGTYRTPRIAPRDHQALTVRVTVASGAPIGRTTAVTVRATTPSDTTRTDTAKAKVTVIPG